MECDADMRVFLSSGEFSYGKLSLKLKKEDFFRTSIPKIIICPQTTNFIPFWIFQRIIRHTFSENELCFVYLIYCLVSLSFKICIYLHMDMDQSSATDYTLTMRMDK